MSRHPSLFFVSIFMNYLLPCLYFRSVCVSLKCVSCRSRVQGPRFLSHSAPVIGAFSSFASKVIVDSYAVVAILLFMFLISSSSRSLFHIACNPGLVVMISFRFFLSETLFVCPSSAPNTWLTEALSSQAWRWPLLVPQQKTHRELRKMQELKPQ